MPAHAPAAKETITDRVRRWFGAAVYCPYCGDRVDLGLGLRTVASPSKLRVDHMPACGHPGARARFILGRQLGRMTGPDSQAVAEALRTLGAGMQGVQLAFTGALREFGAQLRAVEAQYAQAARGLPEGRRTA